jgi:transposase-like protein
MQRTRRDRWRRLPPAQREKLLAAYGRSGLTQKEFAAQAGVGYSTLTAWLGKAAAARLAHPEGGPASFIPVPNLLSAPDPMPAYRIELPGGVMLAVARGFQAEELQALLQVAQRL